MDGCAPTLVLGIKKDGLLPAGEAMEPLSLAIPSLAPIESTKAAYSNVFALVVSFFLSFAIIESWENLRGHICTKPNIMVGDFGQIVFQPAYSSRHKIPT